MTLKIPKIPSATVNRLSHYLRVLKSIRNLDEKIISSDKLAELCGVNPAQVRKDLSYFGEFGIRGMGYYVEDLLSHIQRILGLDKVWRLGIIGMGNLGCALIAHANFLRHGYRFVAAFDQDPQKVYKMTSTGILIHPMERLKEVAQKTAIDIMLIAIPPEKAREVAEQVFSIPIKAILNFAPIHIQAPPGYIVENVDFTMYLDRLTFFLTNKPS